LIFLKITTPIVARPANSTTASVAAGLVPPSHYQDSSSLSASLVIELHPRERLENA
jgi:hypothetical protein